MPSDNVEGKKPTQRLLAAIAYKHGVTQTELAEWYDVQRRTIYSWLKRLDTDEMAARRVGASQPTGGHWLKAWNEDAVDGLRPRFAGGRPAKLSPEQFEELFSLLEEGQPWTPQEIDDLLWDRYGVTYDRAHLARILRADGMQYAKPRPMDPRQSPDAEADFRERLSQALTKETNDEPLVLGFFDASWPQPFENSQRMWSYDRTVEIDKPLVTVPWKTLGFYALLGKSTLIFRKRTTKESICAALEAVREQNPVLIRCSECASGSDERRFTTAVGETKN